MHRAFAIGYSKIQRRHIARVVELNVVLEPFEADGIRLDSHHRAAGTDEFGSTKKIPRARRYRGTRRRDEGCEPGSRPRRCPTVAVRTATRPRPNRQDPGTS